MPDLTIEYHQRCRRTGEVHMTHLGSAPYTQTVCLSAESLDECTCDGFRFRRDCRHVREARAQVCDWNSFSSDEVQTPQQEMEGVCPKCGSETEVTKVGV